MRIYRLSRREREKKITEATDQEWSVKLDNRIKSTRKNICKSWVGNNLLIFQESEFVLEIKKDRQHGKHSGLHAAVEKIYLFLRRRAENTNNPINDD